MLISSGKYAYIAVLDMIDYSVAPSAEVGLRNAISKLPKDCGEIVDLRARRVGGTVFIHFDVRVQRGSSVSDFKEFSSNLKQAVASRFIWPFVSISLDLPSPLKPSAAGYDLPLTSQRSK